jgi:putative zinc finger/helix-turn-helix YgiT family protein
MPIHRPCPSCGFKMKVTRENYRYDESGLPDVTLLGLEVRRCPECGETQAVIPHSEALHRMLARIVAEKPSRLLPDEVRFLRRYLGWSGADFARHMGVTVTQVSRWENGMVMAATADRLLRLFVAALAPVSDYPVGALADLKKEARAIKVRLHPTAKGWGREARAVR